MALSKAKTEGGHGGKKCWLGALGQLVSDLGHAARLRSFLVRFDSTMNGLKNPNTYIYKYKYIKTHNYKTQSTRISAPSRTLQTGTVRVTEVP